MSDKKREKQKRLSINFGEFVLAHKRPNCVPQENWDSISSHNEMQDLVFKHNLWLESGFDEIESISISQEKEGRGFWKPLRKKSENKEEYQKRYDKKIKVYYSEEGYKKAYINYCIAQSFLNNYFKPECIPSLEWDERKFITGEQSAKNLMSFMKLGMKKAYIKKLEEQFNTKISSKIKNGENQFINQNKKANDSHSYNWENDIPNPDW